MMDIELHEFSKVHKYGLNYSFSHDLLAFEPHLSINDLETVKVREETSAFILNILSEYRGAGIKYGHCVIKN